MKKLVRADGQEVKAGDILETSAGQAVEVIIPLTSLNKVYAKWIDRLHPRHGSSQELHPHVVGCSILEEPDGKQ
jgi:hypothetical protein